MVGRISIRLGFVAVWFIAVGSGASAQQITYTVAFDDPGQTAANLYQPITQHVLASGARWNAHLRPITDVILEVRVVIPATNPPAGATGRSLAASPVGMVGGLVLSEQGAAAEVRTGVDPNGAEADIEFVFNPTYLLNQLWLDPDPFQRVTAVPADRTDAMSIILHEFGHAFAFNGYRDPNTGELSGGFLSTYDQHVSGTDNDLVFNGPEATSLYGNRPVPLNNDNLFHLGNESPLPGADLVSDLMNGVEFTNGTRYDISLLDVAVLADSGVPVAPVPEPVLGLGVAAVGLAGWALRRSRRLRTTGPDESTHR
jgi:hypothetical protein